MTGPDRLITGLSGLFTRGQSRNLGPTCCHVLALPRRCDGAGLWRVVRWDRLRVREGVEGLADLEWL